MEKHYRVIIQGRRVLVSHPANVVRREEIESIRSFIGNSVFMQYVYKSLAFYAKIVGRIRIKIVLSLIRTISSIFISHAT